MRSRSVLLRLSQCGYYGGKTNIEEQNYDLNSSPGNKIK